MNQTNKNKTNRDIKKWGMLKKFIFKNLTRKSKCTKSPNRDMESKEKTNLDMEIFTHQNIASFREEIKKKTNLDTCM